MPNPKVATCGRLNPRFSCLMPRIAFTMRLFPGQEAEYERRHRPIWPELAAVLRAHGVEDYAIYLDDSTGILFGHAVVRSLDEWDSIAKEEVCQRWWRHMKPLMATHDDGSPVSTPLREVFRLG
jgi:L-rhamnose mutarotase